MCKFEIFLPNLCPSHSIKALAISLHKPAGKTQNEKTNTTADLAHVNSDVRSKNRPVIREFVHETI